MWNNNSQNIAYHATEDSDPWEMENKWEKACGISDYHLKNFQVVVDGVGNQTELLWVEEVELRILEGQTN